MIQTITLKNVATFDDEGVEFKDIPQINYVYGTNGSGKTTISKYLDNSHNEQFNSCSIKWKNDQQIKTLVYNKDFRDRNFVHGSINGIFTLGQATNEEIKVIEEKIELKRNNANQLSAFTTTLGTEQALTNRTQEEFKTNIWNQAYKKHEGQFKEAFRGSMTKESFKTKILDEYKNIKPSIKSSAELVKQSKIIWDDSRQLLSLNAELSLDRITEIESNEIWRTKIIGKTDVDISKLMQKLNNTDWVNAGRKYLEGETCPFCQSETISKGFLEELENYFDESFLTETIKVKDLDEEYRVVANGILSDLYSISSNQSLISHNKFPKDIFLAYYSQLKTQFTSNFQNAKIKNSELSRVITLESSKDLLIKLNKIIADFNIEVNENNEIVSNLESSKRELIADIWQFIINENTTLIKSFLNKVSSSEKAKDALRSKILECENKQKTLNLEIIELNKNITSVQPSIDRINKILELYGYNNFRIIVSEINPNQYQLRRGDGSPAEETLSEGEVTFITFLYYLQLAKGGDSQESVNEDRILVIDDPISSLDSNILFLVSSLLKDLIKIVRENRGNIKQVILLTHNIYFHKEVSFKDGRSQDCGNTFFWMLRRNNLTTNLQCYQTKNTIFNSYELLWQEIKNTTNNSTITIQNSMRRILENYFKILGKYKDDDIVNKFETSEEKSICRSLFCWINDGSHCISDDMFIQHQDDTAAIYHRVFAKIFEYTNHIEHYNMMMDN